MSTQKKKLNLNLDKKSKSSSKIISIKKIDTKYFKPKSAKTRQRISYKNNTNFNHTHKKQHNSSKNLVNVKKKYSKKRSKRRSIKNTHSKYINDIDIGKKYAC